MQQFIRKYLFYVTLLICCVAFSDICMAQKYIDYKYQREWVDSIIKSKEGKNLILEDFLAPTNRIPIHLDKVCKKGINFYLKGKTSKAYKYFKKLSTKYQYRQYANYQLLYYNNFSKFDPYYEGIPTALMCKVDESLIFHYDYDDFTYLMLSSAYGNESYRPGNIVNFFISYSYTYNDVFKHIILSRTFPIGKDASFGLFNLFQSKSFLEGFKFLQQSKYLLPYISQMNSDNDIYEEDGLGKSAKELYELAQQIDDDEHKLFLLSRSSLWGNLDATIELINYYPNLCNRKTSNETAKKLLGDAKELCSIMKKTDEYKAMIPFIDKCYNAFDENYKIASKNLEKEKQRERERKLAEKEAEKEAKRERRRRMWGNILAGVAQAATATMNQMYGGGYAMTPQTYSVPSYSGNIAAQMSQPGYFNDVYNQMIQQTMSQAQQQQWNEYQNAQSFFQKMGTNITFEEYQQGLINGFNTVVPQLNVNWNNIDWNNVNWNNIDSQSVDSYDMTTYSGNSPGNSTGTTTSRDILNSSGGGDCLLCHGDGKCFNCHGNGISNNMGITKTCETCKNNRGVCPQCHGTKVASWNR